MAWRKREIHQSSNVKSTSAGIGGYLNIFLPTKTISLSYNSSLGSPWLSRLVTIMALYKQGPKLRPSLGHIDKIYYFLLLSHTSQLPTWLYFTFPLSSFSPEISYRTFSEMWHSTSDLTNLIATNASHSPFFTSSLHITQSFIHQFISFHPRNLTSIQSVTSSRWSRRRHPWQQNSPTSMLSFSSVSLSSYSRSPGLIPLPSLSPVHEWERAKKLKVSELLMLEPALGTPRPYLSIPVLHIYHTVEIL